MRCVALRSGGFLQRHCGTAARGRRRRERKQKWADAFPPARAGCQREHAGALFAAGPCAGYPAAAVRPGCLRGRTDCGHRLASAHGRIAGADPHHGRGRGNARRHGNERSGRGDRQFAAVPGQPVRLCRSAIGRRRHGVVHPRRLWQPRPARARHQPHAHPAEWPSRGLLQPLRGRRHQRLSRGDDAERGNRHRRSLSRLRLRRGGGRGELHPRSRLHRTSGFGTEGDHRTRRQL